MIIFKTSDGQVAVDVSFDGETTWLTIDQMAELFERNKSTISRHIKNVFEEGELERNSVVANFATTAKDSKIYHYLEEIRKLGLLAKTDLKSESG